MEGEDDDKVSTSKFIWPRDLVVARRIDSLCELVLNPKPLTIRQTRKRKSNTGSSTNRKKTKVDPIKNEEILSDEEMDDDEEDDDADEEDEGNAPSPAADDIYQLPYEAPIEEAFAAPPQEEFVMQEDKEEQVQEPVGGEAQV